MRETEEYAGANVVHWFGVAWGAPLCAECPHVGTPVGVLCPSCDLPIEDGHRGVTMVHTGLLPPPYSVPGALFQRSAWHIECHLRSILPGFHHLAAHG